MYHAIETRYFGPTNVRGSRVKAKCQARSIILHWDDTLNSDDNHRLAAETLARRMEWTGVWHGGVPPDGKGCVFVMVTSDPCDSFTVRDVIRTRDETAGAVL